MKKKLRGALSLSRVLLILLMVIAMTSIFADFSIISEGYDFVEVEFNLPDFQLEPLEVDGELFYRFIDPDKGFLMEKGLPEILTYSTILAIPDRGDYSIEEPKIIDTSIYSDINIFPSQGFDFEISPTEGFQINRPFYKKNAFYPSYVAKGTSPSIMRDMRLVSLTLYPFSFNPAKKELEVHKRVTVRLSFNHSDKGENEILTPRRKYSRSFEGLLSENVLNYSQFRDGDLEYQTSSLLIVHSKNETILNTVNQFAEWKREKGFYVKMIDNSEFSSNMAIKNYIQNAYDYWDNPPEYVLFIGNGIGSVSIPYFTFHGSGGDHFYSLLNGSDDLSDIFVGRFFIENLPQLQTIWNKIQNYEKKPYMVNKNWFKNSLLVGDPATSGVSTIITCRYVKETIQTKFPSNTFSEVYAPPFSSQIDNALTKGSSLYLYRGLEATSGWSPSESTMSNGFMLPNVALVTCGTLDYVSANRSVSLANLGTPTNSRGAITVIGSSSRQTTTALNNSLTGGLYYGIYKQDMRTMGEALVRGKLYMWQSFGNTHPDQPPQFSQWFNLVGDPSMNIWVDTPKTLKVVNDKTILNGTNSIYVRVTDDTDLPVSDALVSLYSQGDEIARSAYTNGSGEAIIYIDQETFEKAKLTVTKPDYAPNLSEVSLGEEGAVALHNLIINGNLMAGSTVDFVVQLKNFDLTTANGVTASIHTDSEYIGVNKSSSTFGNIPFEGTKNSQTDYQIIIDETTPSNHKATFLLTIMDDDERLWKSRFEFTILNADLVPQDIYLNNTVDGFISPGETGYVKLFFKNEGSASVNSLYAKLNSTYGVTVQDSIVYLGNVNPGARVNTGNEGFYITTAGNLIPGMMPSLDLELYNSNGFYQKKKISIPIGRVTVDDPLGPDEYGYWCYDSGDEDYLYAPVYEWLEIAPQHGGYGINTGLKGDHSNNQQVVHKDLPFTFKFYGVDYDKISICSNGWLSFGITEQAEQRNWRLPGPLGPKAMIAAFWDNLAFTLDTSGIYTFYNVAENIFIIQWQNGKNLINNAEETFQIILYDPEHYMTSTGDGPIKIQYKTFNNVNHGLGSPYGNWGNYCTVGISDHTCKVGLEYTFGNMYPEAARPIKNGTALYFVTSTDYYQPFVAIDNYSISDYLSNEPHYDETVSIDMSLTNFGNETAGGVAAKLTSTDPHVVILEDYATFDSIASEESVTNEKAYTIKISDSIPDRYEIPFELEVTASGGLKWTHKFRIAVKAPKVISNIPIVYDPAPGGNNNGLIDAGETLDLYIPFVNIGGADTKSVKVIIESTTPIAEINSCSDLYFDKISANEMSYSTLNITTVEQIDPGTTLSFDYTVKTGKYEFKGTAYIGIGGYVNAEIGLGVNTNNASTPNPINIYSRSLRTQTVYTVEELTEAGVLGGEAIVSLGYFVFSAPRYPLSNFIVRLTHTSAKDASYHYSGPLATVYTNSSYEPKEGDWDMLMLTEPFVWNGEDNLLVDTAFSPVIAWNSSGRQRVYRVEDGFRYGASESYDMTNERTDTVSFYKPQIKFVFDTTTGTEGAHKPRQLEALNVEHGIELTWESPGLERAGSIFSSPGAILSTKKNRGSAISGVRTERSFIGYNIYRNGLLINIEPITENNYLDEEITFNEQYFYYVTALYEEGESVPSNVIQIRAKAKTEPPMFAPEAGVYYEKISLSLEPVEAGTEIYYTLDGSEPSRESSRFVEPIEINWHTLVKAIAYQKDAPPSNVVAAQYYILYAPQNVIAEVDGYDVEISWEEPWKPEDNGVSRELKNTSMQNKVIKNRLSSSSRALEGYNVYRSGEEDTFILLNDEPLSETHFIDIDLEIGVYSYYITAIYSEGESKESQKIEVEILEASSVEDEVVVILKTELYNAYPNPFNPSTTIRFGLKDNSAVLLEVYNISGGKVKTLLNQQMLAGKHRVVWNGANEQGKRVGSGIYFYRLSTPEYNQIKKVLMLK